MVFFPPNYSVIVDFPCVLISQTGNTAAAMRIELHIKGNGDDTYSLLCFSGLPIPRPNRQKLQGPYHRRSQAMASARAIIACLLGQDFSVVEQPAIWVLLAQQLGNQQSVLHRQHAGKDDFDPTDVYFE